MMDARDLQELRKNAQAMNVFGKYIDELRAGTELEKVLKDASEAGGLRKQVAMLKNHRWGALAGLAGVIATLMLLRPKRRPTIQVNGE